LEIVFHTVLLAQPRVAKGGVQTFRIKVMNSNEQHSLAASGSVNRIEFPNPAKAITSMRPERRLPGRAKSLARRVVNKTTESAGSSNPTERARELSPGQPLVIERAPSDSIPATEAVRPTPLRTDKIALQINTVPVNTDIYVDDRFVGQAPVKVYVERGRNHVVQLVREGYEEKLIVIESRRLQAGEIFLVVEKLVKSSSHEF
jgi:hypothetical protein